MNIYEAPGAIVAFLAVVAVMPPMMYWVNTRAADLSLTTQFMAALVPVALIALLVTSWFAPGGA